MKALIIGICVGLLAFTFCAGLSAVLLYLKLGSFTPSAQLGEGAVILASLSLLGGFAGMMATIEYVEGLEKK